MRLRRQVNRPFAHQDYQRLRQQGMRTAREGLRWHLVEASPGNYDFTSALSLIRCGGRIRRAIDLGFVPLRVAGLARHL